MDLGAFSVSLSVRDLAASQAFYETLGFTPFGGDASQNWLIMRNGAQPLESFTDVRQVQGALKAAGVPLIQEADEAGVGPASIVLTDPDGNTILIDQHV
jgi:catechol 2,3-dioxygenase-like lactoylglutathione lyase family enzyme